VVWPVPAGKHGASREPGNVKLKSKAVKDLTLATQKCLCYIHFTLRYVELDSENTLMNMG
jgi:hypothetical protein